MKNKLFLSCIMWTLLVILTSTIFVNTIIKNQLENKLTVYKEIENTDTETKETKKEEIKGNIYSSIDSLETYYLALNGKKTLEFKNDYPEDYKFEINYTIENPDIISIDKNTIYGKNVGETNIHVYVNDIEKKKYHIYVTDLIVPPTVNHNKKALPCKKYTKEEADLLDKILESRVQEGIKGSRGGVVAAARFITLEFPYLIKYFNENGRLETGGGRRKVDGEGRYYHEGLYLHESKFETLYTRDDGSIYKDTGPAIWGCPLYDRFVDKKRANGLTCSGFVTWAMLNGGFEVSDVGAGEHSNLTNELSDLGPHHEITLNYMKNNTYKVGDFIGRNGHAALIIGFDDTTLYVAEELPRNPGTSNLDLNVYTYGRYDNYNKLPGHNKRGVVVDDNLTYVIEMSNIYPNGDGWTTDIWE